MRKRVYALLSLVLLICSLSLTASAHAVPDLSAGGSIAVRLQHKGQALTGGSLTFYRVAEIQEEDSNYTYALTGSFAASGLPLTDVQSPELAESLAAWVQTHAVSGKTVQVQDGKTLFPVEKGKLGLYLVVQHQACTGYEPLAPFVVGVPMARDGGYVYTVDAAPKMGELTPESHKPTPDYKPDKKPEEKPNETPDQKPVVPPSKPTPPSKPVLPQAGQLNWPVPVLALLGLVLFTAGWVLRFKRNRHES